MHNDIWQTLQLFAEGGTGGAGAAGEGAGPAATGETDTAAGYHQRLRELGVPEGKIRKNRAQKTSVLPEGAVRSQKEEEPTQAAAAKEETPDENDPEKLENVPAQTEKPRMTWEEVKADPELNKEIQNLMQKRLKESGPAVEAMGVLAPALEVLAKSMGMDPGNMDYKALAEKIMNNDDLYSQRALDNNRSVEDQKRMDQLEMQLNMYQQRDKRTIQERKIQEHIATLEQQGEELKKVYPSFDLRRELQNPTFARMVGPEGGFDVSTAYYAVHHKDIQNAQAQVIASQTAQQFSNAIQANSRRPEESGGSQAPSTTKFDYRNASPQQREALKAEIRRAKQEGRKIYPGR